MQRQPNVQQVKFFLELDATGQLNLDPPYQRRSVWSDDYRQYFVDTILRGYPSPTIYLAIETFVTRPTVYNVLDGKQRLLSLIEFARDGFHTGKYLAEQNLDDKYFSELPSELQEAFVKYSLPVENISDATDSDLKQAFDRLNRNVARLVPQELRHAMFDGVFIGRMEALAEESFWTEIGLSTKARVRRMRDIEFVSELFLLTMQGGEALDGGREILDDYYASYDEGIPDEAEHRARFDHTRRYLERLPLSWNSQRWRNLGDLYSLWAAVLKIGEDALPEPDAAAERLQAFGTIVDEVPKLPPPAEGAEESVETQRARRYSAAVRQGANKDTNRETRAEVLVEVLTA